MDMYSACCWSLVSSRLFSLLSFGGIWGFPHRLHFTQVLFFSQNALLLGAWLEGSAFLSFLLPPFLLLLSFPYFPSSSVLFSLLAPNSLLILFLLLHHLLFLHLLSRISYFLLHPAPTQQNSSALFGNKALQA